MEENFVLFLERNARRYASNAALVWKGGSLTWAELDQQTSGFAQYLVDQGIRVGDRIAILLPNGRSFVVPFLGTLRAGAVAVPLSPDLKDEELGELFSDLRPKLVVDEVKAVEGACFSPAPAPSAAVIVYTSGSTGQPKGALFSHSALTFANQTWGGVVMGLKDDDVVLGVLPYSHNYGMYAGLLSPLLFGATVALVEHFTPEAVLDAIKSHRVTIFPGVATMFRRLLNSPSFSASALSSLRLAVSGAAPCSPELCAEWGRNTNVRIVRGYGSTEVPRPISFFADDLDDFPGAIGRPVPGVQVRVVDEEGKALPEGEVGELWIKSPAAMDGYLNDPDETLAVLKEGWFRTGDLGSVAPEGFVQLVGRSRDRILRGGYSVFPQEIEAVLCSHSAVAEAAVVGIPDADLGEEIAAVVTLRPDEKTTSEALVAYCREHLAHHKYPRQLTIAREIPHGATGKILKSQLLKGLLQSIQQ